MLWSEAQALAVALALWQGNTVQQQGYVGSKENHMVGFGVVRSHNQTWVSYILKIKYLKISQDAFKFSQSSHFLDGSIGVLGEPNQVPRPLCI